MLKRNNLILHCRPNIETIDANMLGEVMLLRILSNADGTATVTVHRRRSGDRNTKISQQPPKLSHLSRHTSQSTQLSLSTGTRNRSLLLGLPGNQGGSKEDKVGRDGLEV